LTLSRPSLISWRFEIGFGNERAGFVRYALDGNEPKPVGVVAADRPYRAAQGHDQGLSQGFGRRIPHCHIERRNRSQHHALPAQEMQRAHSLFESIETGDLLTALLLRHVLNERDDRFGRGGAIRFEIAVADDAFFRMHVSQDERKVLEFTQPGDNRAAQRQLNDAHHDFVQRQPHPGCCLHLSKPPEISL
jgi:hypothetical protein